MDDLNCIIFTYIIAVYRKSRTSVVGRWLLGNQDVTVVNANYAHGSPCTLPHSENHPQGSLRPHDWNRTPFLRVASECWKSLCVQSGSLNVPSSLQITCKYCIGLYRVLTERAHLTDHTLPNLQRMPYPYFYIGLQLRSIWRRPRLWNLFTRSSTSHNHPFHTVLLILFTRSSVYTSPPKALDWTLAYINLGTTISFASRHHVDRFHCRCHSLIWSIETIVLLHSSSLLHLHSRHNIQVFSFSLKHIKKLRKNSPSDYTSSQFMARQLSSEISFSLNWGTPSHRVKPIPRAHLVISSSKLPFGSYNPKN